MGFEIRMLEGIPGIDSFAPIQLQQFCQQVLSFWMQAVSACQEVI